MNELRLSGVIKESIVDGPGIRFVVFAQGCPHSCKGCHNPSTHSLIGGFKKNIKDIIDAIKKDPILSGVTFSGGEPFLQAEGFYELAKEAHKLNLNVFTYTGYTIEQLLKKSEKEPVIKKLIEQSDTIIDGPFILEQKSLMLKFRGSKNQRAIDPKRTLERGVAIEKEI